MNYKKTTKPKSKTSWQPVETWYKKAVGLSGQYFHQQVILPRTITLLNLEPNSSVLDLACGQGVLSRAIDPKIYYQGLDLAPSLIQFAKDNDPSPKHHFKVVDLTKPLSLEKQDFSHTTIILSLQNIETPHPVIQNAYKHMVAGGKLVIVLNHPYFRIPKHTSWGIDEENKIQYRRLNSYLTPQKIPIQTAPSQDKAFSIVWSFHQPLSYYSEILSQFGFVILKIEEWVSDKKSEGRRAVMENKARSEFPMFMAILARKG